MISDQSVFRTALLDANAHVPEGLKTPSGQVATRRFGVYRNNVVHSLTEAMRASFPIIEKLIGAENFSAIARSFVRQHPPSSPLMMFYGTEFPNYLHSFKPLSHIGYLPDVARLELALRTAYHAADAPALEAARLAEVPPEKLGETVFQFAPSAQLIRSKWPLFDIWRYNTQPNAPKPRAQAQDVLVTRPEFDPAPHALDPEAGDWIQDLMRGAPLAEAGPAGFNPTVPLTLLLNQNALTGLTTKEDTHDFNC